MIHPDRHVTDGGPTVAVVVVSHETRDEALGCLASLEVREVDPRAEREIDPRAEREIDQRAERDDLEVVLVDTGSRDGTAAAVRDRFPAVRVLELANAGYGRGANAGVRATSAPAVVVCNADVRFAPGGPHDLAAGLRDDVSVGVVGPRVVYPDGRSQASARALPDVGTAIGHAVLRWVVPGNRFTARYRRTAADPTDAQDVGWVSGCALLVRRAAFDSVDGFDPGYPLYLEDVDLAARLHDAGWRVRFDPRTTVAHRVGASTSRRRWRALVWHARGLDRFVARRYVAGPSAVLLRPALRVALGAWVLVTSAAERTVGRGRSTTGE